MKLAIMQPYFFPYIGYFQLINLVDKFIIYDDVNFINRGWINRNNILINGKANLVSIPLANASQNKLINEVSIIGNNDWKLKMDKTISLAYKKAPHFNKVYPLIKECLFLNETSVHKYNAQILKMVCAYLKIETTFTFSSEQANSNKELKSQYRILDICIKENALHYINPIGGIELYDKDIFQERNIRLNFIKTGSIDYKQYNNTFVPNLSIIDVMMFNTVEETHSLLHQYELI